MKKYIVIYNKNSRGKTYSKQDLEMIFSSHDLDSKIFVTNEIKQVDKIVKNFKNSKDYAVYLDTGFNHPDRLWGDPEKDCGHREY